MRFRLEIITYNHYFFFQVIKPISNLRLIFCEKNYYKLCFYQRFRKLTSVILWQVAELLKSISQFTMIFESLLASAAFRDI